VTISLSSNALVQGLNTVNLTLPALAAGGLYTVTINCETANLAGTPAGWTRLTLTLSNVAFYYKLSDGAGGTFTIGVPASKYFVARCYGWLTTQRFELANAVQILNQTATFGLGATIPPQVALLFYQLQFCTAGSYNSQGGTPSTTPAAWTNIGNLLAGPGPTFFTSIADAMYTTLGGTGGGTSSMSTNNCNIDLLLLMLQEAPTGVGLFQLQDF
jgi:hypothetical protein